MFEEHIEKSFFLPRVDEIGDKRFSLHLKSWIMMLSLPSFVNEKELSYMFFECSQTDEAAQQR